MQGRGWGLQSYDVCSTLLWLGAHSVQCGSSLANGRGEELLRVRKGPLTVRAACSGPCPVPGLGRGRANIPVLKATLNSYSFWPRVGLCQKTQRLRGFKEGLHPVCASWVQILCCALQGGRTGWWWKKRGYRRPVSRRGDSLHLQVWKVP